MLQEKYWGFVYGLQQLLVKGQRIAVQQMRTTMSGLMADIAKAKSSVPVFQQAASLASSEDGRASIIRECTATSNRLTSLMTDEHNLRIQIKQGIEQHRSVFCQQLLTDIWD